MINTSFLVKGFAQKVIGNSAFRRTLLQKDTRKANEDITISSNKDNKDNIFKEKLQGDQLQSDLKVKVGTLGRLGNMFFQYMSGLGIALYHNRTPVFNQRMTEIKKIFPNAHVNVVKNSTGWRSKYERSGHAFDSRLFHLPRENLHVRYWLQSFKYFQGISKYVYHTMLSTFESTLLQKAKAFIEGVKCEYRKREGFEAHETNVTTVCVHVRRGDYLKERNIEHGFLTPSAMDIKNAMNYLENKFKNTVFIIASNGIKWCKENLNGSNVFFSNMTSPNEDFVLLSSCDHMIQTVGTFSWWAGWLTSWRGGTVMYYQHQFAENTRVYGSFMRQDCFLGHWLAYTNMSITKSKLLGDK